MTDATKKSVSPKKGQLLALLVMLALFAIGTYQALSGSKGFVNAEIDAEHLGVCGTYGEAFFVALCDIEDILLTDSFDFGTCIAGEETGNTVSGLYSCAAYDQYTVHAYTDTTSCIVVRHQDGILVFNCETDSLTEKIYDQLVQAVG